MKRFIDWIANIYLLVALLGFIVLISLITLEIIFRYFLNNSMVWSHEFLSIVISWITFLGFGKVINDKEDIMITVLVKKLGTESIRMLSIINNIIMLLISGGFLIYSTKLTINHLDRSTTIMNWSSSWYYLPLVLLMGLVVLISIHRTFLAFQSKEDFFNLEQEE